MYKRIPQRAAQVALSDVRIGSRISPQSPPSHQSAAAGRSLDTLPAPARCPWPFPAPWERLGAVGRDLDGSDNGTSAWKARTNCTTAARVAPAFLATRRALSQRSWGHISKVFLNTAIIWIAMVFSQKRWLFQLPYPAVFFRALVIKSRKRLGIRPAVHSPGGAIHSLHDPFPVNTAPGGWAEQPCCSRVLCKPCRASSLHLEFKS